MFCIMYNEKVSKKTIDDVLKIPVSKSVLHRLPWLVIGLFGGLLAAQVVGYFESTLKSNLILATFIPLIVYISDAVGTQMEAFVIRDMAIQKRMHIVNYILKQFIIISVTGAILSLILFPLTAVLYKDLSLAFVLSLSLFVAIISSLITGLIIPYIFNKFRFDPANASGPIATIIQDLMSVTIYFYIANLLLG